MSSTLGYLRQAREWAYPTLKTSAFLEKGVLTPEEFVKAGDELVFRCPTWAWESGDPKKVKSFLPTDKQYLVTRNVPCQTRVASMENHIAEEGLDDDEGDWLVSSIIKQEFLHRQLELFSDTLDLLVLHGNVDNAIALFAHRSNSNFLTLFFTWQLGNLCRNPVHWILFL